MNAEKLETRPGHTTVDATADGRVLLVHFDDELESTAVLLTPAMAAKLGHRLIHTAAQVESPT